MNIYWWILWCWRRLLRVPWTARRSYQSILKEISTKHSLEGLMLKLKLQKFALDVKNWLIGKALDVVNVLRQEEKGMTENEMVGWHHRFDGHELEQAQKVSDGQGSLACCSPWGHKESRRQLSNWTELNWIVHIWTFESKFDILYFLKAGCITDFSFFFFLFFPVL